jgi:hypothetical protein
MVKVFRLSWKQRKMGRPLVIEMAVCILFRGFPLRICPVRVVLPE